MFDPDLFVRIKNPKKPGDTFVLAKRDFDPAVHCLADDPREAPSEDDLDTTPGGISTVNVEDALSLIASADTLVELKALETDEKAGKHRKTVLEAIADRRRDIKG